MKSHCLLLLSLTLSVAWSANICAQVAIHGDIIYTSAGAPIKDGMLVIKLPHRSGQRQTAIAALYAPTEL